MATEMQSNSYRNKSDISSNNNGAIGPSKQNSEDGRLALDKMQEVQWGNVPRRSMKIIL